MEETSAGVDEAAAAVAEGCSGAGVSDCVVGAVLGSVWREEKDAIEAEIEMRRTV